MNLTTSDKEYVRQYHGVFRSREDAEEYLTECWERTELIMSWLKELSTQGVSDVLELGANPYCLSVLIQKHFSFNLQLANYFGDPARNGPQTDTIDVGLSKENFAYQHFNVETDRFPYADATFDCVLFCEIIEHLLTSPDAALSEISRVLQPGGFVIISTPNALRVSNIVQLIRGRNIYPGYSSHGPHGRHNREYSLDELAELLRRHRFDVVSGEVVDLHRHSWMRRLAKTLGPAWWRDHLFVMGKLRPELQNVSDREMLGNRPGGLQ